MVDFKDILNQDILNLDSVTMLGGDFIIIDSPILSSTGRYPYNNRWLIATICEKGYASGTVNLRDYRIEEGGFIIILPGQVIVHSELSSDFKGKILLISSRFAESLDIGNSLTLTASIEQRPYYQFQQDAIDIVLNYISSCRTMIRCNGDSTTTRDVLRLLSRAFFMGAAPLLSSQGRDSGAYSRLTEDFLLLVEKEYRNHRQLDYYARELGYNTKYLSRRIKEETGKNATDWIERSVVIDAQAQLVSTRNTILEISYSLGFPSQSFFGKYFRRVMGISPKEYRSGQKKN